MLVSYDRVSLIKLLLLDLLYDIAFVNFMLIYNCLFIKKINFSYVSFAPIEIYAFVTQCNWIYPLAVTRMHFSRVSERDFSK